MKIGNNLVSGGGVYLGTLHNQCAHQSTQFDKRKRLIQYQYWPLPGDHLRFVEHDLVNRLM